MRAVPTALAAAGAVGLGVGAAAHVWARHVEIHRFTLREAELRILPPGARTLRVLHLSDVHLVPDQERKIAFLRHLGSLRPHLVIDTGDNIASAAAVPVLAEALAPLLERPGAFVMGSNDMFAPGPKNPLRYFLPDPRPEGMTERTDRDLPTEELAAALSARGWEDLTNRRASIELGALEVRLVGVDDPHLERDEMPAPERPDRPLPSHGNVLRLGVAHAPYRRVLDAFTADGADLILAGHTHGGQLRLPGIGALVTNCDLPRSQARGLSSWRGVPLNVSAGLGASPYSNYRLFTPPEATLLTLRSPKPGTGA
ncbi:metallophosphoesterase [Brachybacterium sp. J153]|uniref:metallophosphoesterase n=1 Tax=Brachybacterium sp. J153 TaxID=3116488 RepID=UPI002E788FD5|nr:metallophosphoesterase [Brachybacterium sp. J153]MEE1617987.1 metallophosphoesterase [Brachybacterium sp. J153]